MRRLLGAVMLCAFLVGGWPGVHAARAQSPTAVAMRLLSESPWTGPRRNLELSFEATNLGLVPLEGLSVLLSIQAPARSRSEYALSLRADATSLLLATPFEQGGSLPPGQSRAFRLRQTLGILASREETAMYPLKVELRSQDTTIGVLRTPLIFLSESPKVPLNLQWTWVFSAPLQYRPDGIFLPGPIESDIGPDGRLSLMAQAAVASRQSTLDIVVSTVLLDELGRMRNGYRILDSSGNLKTVRRGTGGAAAADELLSTLVTIARRPAAEVVALPFGDPTLPAMMRSNTLSKDLATLVERGQATVGDRLGVTPAPNVFRPLFSQLDVPSTNRIRTLGAEVLLVDPDLLSPGAASKFTTSALVQVVGVRRPIAAVVPDALVLTRAAASPADPVLAAHAALGELAAIWLEFPGTPNRGTAVLFGESNPVNAAFLPSFASLVRVSGWLRPVSATSLAAITPVPIREQRRIAPRVYPGFDADYVNHLLFTRTSLTQFDRTATGARPLVERLQTQLLLAESSAFVSDPDRGRLFVDSAYAVIQQTYKRILISPTPVTLTSRQGSIPVTLRNQTGYTIRVKIVLLADRRVSFVKGDTVAITLQASQRTLLFPVRAETTGRFPVKVQVQTPVTTGPQTIAEAEVLVRSTAYNRVALVLTIGAGLFLLGWWGRRFLPRRRS
jgi:hypothetical protein